MDIQLEHVSARSLKKNTEMMLNLYKFASGARRAWMEMY